MACGISALFVGGVLALTPAVAGTAVAGAPDQAPSQADSAPVTDAEAFSIVAGQILGAASACDQIDAGRVAAATDKAAGIASETANDENDVAAAKQLMIDAAEKGRDSVKNGDADCASVQLSFAKLEQIEDQGDQQPGHQEQLGEVPQGEAGPQAPAPFGRIDPQRPNTQPDNNGAPQ